MHKQQVQSATDCQVLASDICMQMFNVSTTFPPYQIVSVKDVLQVDFSVYAICYRKQKLF